MLSVAPALPLFEPSELLLEPTFNSPEPGTIEWMPGNAEVEAPASPSVELPELPSVAPDDQRGTGGYVEFDNKDTTTPRDPTTETDRDTREVLALLGSLRYVPQQAGTDPIVVSKRAADSDLPESDALLKQNGWQGAARALNADGITETEGISPTSASSRIDNSELEGGMVRLLRERVIAEVPSSDSARSDNTSFLNAPVRMDSAYGKYQAFEVSTAEERSRPSEPLTPSQETFLPWSDSPPRNMDALDADVLCEPDSAQELVDPSAEWTMNAGFGPVTSSSEGHSKTNSLVCSAVGVLFVGYAVQASRSGQADEISRRARFVVPPLGDSP